MASANDIQKIDFSLDWQLKQHKYTLQRIESIHKQLQDLHYLLETEQHVAVEEVTEALDGLENDTLEALALLERLNLNGIKEMLNKLQTNGK